MSESVTVENEVAVSEEVVAVEESATVELVEEGLTALEEEVEEVEEFLFYRKEDFKETPARTALEGFKGRYTYSPEQTTEEVGAIIEKVKDSLPAYGAGARFVFIRMFYSKPGNADVLDHATFSVRPTRGYALSLDANEKFTLNFVPSFYDDLLEKMIQWLDNYEYTRKLEHNLNYLNGLFAKAVAQRDENFKIEFTLGEGLVDARDDYALIGISEKVIIDELSSTNPNNGIKRIAQMKADAFYNQIVDTVAQIDKPYELLKVDSSVTKNFGIYSRKSLRKLMRNFVSRKMTFVHLGTGYYENASSFAVIDKTPVTPEQEASFVANLQDKGVEYVVIDNENPTKNDTKRGWTRIVVSYRVSPFVKSTKEDAPEVVAIDLLEASKGIGHVEGKTA